MKPPWEGYLGSNPELYARKVLNVCGLRRPPICERTIVDYLRLEVVEITTADIRNFLTVTGDGNAAEMFRTLDTTSAWLERSPGKKPRICVRQETRPGRKRMGILHECGHFLLPLHRALNYFCTEADLHPAVRKRVEQEAFLCAAEFLMPRQMFVEDALSLEIGLSAVEQLRYRYEASMEATAIRYANTPPGPCAIVMVAQAKNGTVATPRDRVPSEQLLLPMELPPKSQHSDDGARYPLAVKYFVRSPGFPKFIRAGTGIEEGNRVYDAWARGTRVKDEIPASVFGSSGNWVYHAECLPLGRSGKVMVLLWLPDHQPRLL